MDSQAQQVFKSQIKNSHNRDFIKKIKPGLYGIIIGLFLFGIIIFFLDYIKIINVFSSSNNSKNVNKSESVIPVISSLIYQKADKAGYSICWELAMNNNINDSSGRSILACKDRVINGWTDKFGLQINEKSKSELARITGIFMGWEKIEGKKDKYIILKDMSNEEEIKLMVKYIRSDSYEDVESETLLSVDNLNYGSLNKNIEPIKKIDYFKNITDEKLNTIIKMGDIICAYVVVDKEINAPNFFNDKNEILTAKEIQIRRFGGIDIINHELKYNE